MDARLSGQHRDPEQNLLQQQPGAVVHAGIEQLPEELRITLILADSYGLSYTEISQCTRVRIETVRARLSHARLRLRDYLLQHQHLLPAQYRFKPCAESATKVWETVATESASNT